MAVNNSDYNKPRTNLLDVTNETFKSETSTSLIENTFNRMLSKDETVEISGAIGDADPAIRVDRRIQEDSVHRQAYQLQPLMYTKVATVDHAKSTKDLYNQLIRLGVDVDRLPIWGDTERFNFAPPVDLDKLTNFTDYYWYDETGAYPVPQYVVVKNKCSAFTARMSQKNREIAGIGDSTPIFNASTVHNTISLLGNLTKNFQEGTRFDIVGSLGVDGLYSVVDAEFVDNFTVITPDPALPSTQYGGGSITFDTVKRELIQAKNTVCEGSAGWDSASWDDSERSEKDGVFIDDPMQLAYIKAESPDVYSVIVRKHPEYLDGDCNIVVPDARPLWSWMDQPKPEFIYKWDATGQTTPQNDWQVENKWIHKLDLPPGAIAKSIRASLPIIEYLPNLEMNEWSYTAHKWLHRESSTQGSFLPIDREPTDAEYADVEFLDKWIYVGPADTVPVNHQTESSAAELMTIDSKNAEYLLATYVAGRITQLNPTNRTFVVEGDYKASGTVMIHSPDGKYDVEVESAVYAAGVTTVTLVAGTSLIGITDGDVVMYPSGTRPFNAVLFTDNPPASRSEVVVAGQQNTRVYVDGREQIGNYSELLKHKGGTYFVNGVFMEITVSKQSQFEVGIDPSAEVDKNRALWDVRTTQFIDDQVFKSAGRPTSAVCPIRFRLHQQRKKLGITKFPLFDIYYPTGETAYRANELFTFVVDPTAAVDFNIGLRIKRTNSKKVYHFKQLLLDYDNGPLFCYKDFDEIETNPSALFTIWRTSDHVRYIPRYVDENKHEDGEEYYINGTKYVAEVPFGSGDWEVPSQLYFNGSHENRVEVTSIQLLEHIKTILRNQATLEGFLPNEQYGHRLLEKIDYSVGGTIHEHNDSWDLLASSLFATNATPPDILNFAATSYESAISAQEEYVLSHAYAALINTSGSYVGDLTAAITKAAIETYEANDNNNRLFGDTSAWINGKGVESWPATAPILGLSALSHPIFLTDDKLDIAEIKHHDGHVSFNRITQGAMVAVAKRVIRTKVKVTNTVSRFRGWTPQQAADMGTPYASYTAIPVQKLAAADYWLAGTEFKRFEVISIGPFMPAVDSPTGSLWLRDTDFQLMEKVNNVVTPWAPLTINNQVVPAGEIAPAWKTVDLTAVLNNLLMTIETRLYEAALEHKHEELAFPKNQYILNDADKELYTVLRERMFKEFVVSRQIAYPYASVYIQTDPFSWNVGGIEPSVVTNPFVDERELNWKATWQGNYLEIYGTLYPHLQPWILQGFNSKPTWWDIEYADRTGVRRWSNKMWENVVNNDVPAEYDAPEDFVLVDVDGATYKRMVKKYNFVPVNTSQAITSGSTTLYDVDDLFPIYDSRLLTAAIVDPSSIGRPLVHAVPGPSVNFKAAYKFGDVSPIELEWLKSTQYIFDEQKIAFLMQPMRYMHNVWGNNYLHVGGLNINGETLKVFAHGDTIFHGDVIDGRTYQSVGLNQWYSYYIRQTGIDFKVSNLRELWTSWNAMLAYQFGGFVNTKSLIVRSTGTTLIKEDYTIFSKKSPGYDSMWLDSLNVTVANYGASSISRGVRIPQGDGKDWTFTISLPANNSRVVNYYGTRRFTFTVVDEDAGTMKIDGATLPWATGDLVYIDSTKYLPFPLDTVYQYYAIVVSASEGTFRLARTAGDAHNGVAVQLRTPGEGTQYIGEVHSTFFAYNGSRTDIAWKHHVVDKAQLKELASPFTVQGIQGLIDVIDGYIAYKKDEGFVFNDSSEKETDWNTTRLVSWQTETERAIDTIYKGLGLNNSAIRQYGTTHEVGIVDIDADPDVFYIKNGVSPFQYADRIVFFTTGTLPEGLALNTTYYAIPDEDDNTKFRVATTALNAYDEIGINVTSEGTGALYAGSFNAPTATADSVIEVNPFRYNLWINTPRGILADVFTGGDSFNSNEVLMYDQYGRPIPKGAAMVFRKDRQAHLKIRPIIVNDVLVDNANPTMYNLIHLGGIKAYIDGYEHVVIFNDYTTNDQMIYDAFVGMSMPRFNVEFQRAENRNLRPNIGGYFLNGANMLRNIEASIDDMRSYYRTYDVNENSDYVDYARALLGYEPPTYLDHLNTPLKSKFLFWKGMIQQKGSRNAIRSFINSEHFVDAKVDEFWAYKLADFGDARPRFKPRIRVSISDATNNDVRLEFTDVAAGPTNDLRFKQITLADQTRWIDLPTTRNDLGGRNMIFNARAKSFIFDDSSMQLLTGVFVGSRLAILPHAVELPIVEKEVTLGTTVAWERITTYSAKNSRAYVIDVPTGRIRITGYVPDTQALDPIELIDTKSATTVQRTKYWNPIAGNQYYVPMTSIDFMCDEDPAQYVSVDDWAANKVGTIWADTSTFKYVPYEDTTVFPDLNDRVERWGRLAEYASADVYEWVASSQLPSEYADDETKTGTPFKIWTKLNSESTYDEVDLSPIESWVDHESALLELSSRDQRLELTVYVNGVLVDNFDDNLILSDVLAAGSLTSQYGTQVQDQVVFILNPTAELLEDGEYIHDYKWIVLAGVTQPTYYYWVSNKAERGTLHASSATEIRMQLTKPQVPYHIFLNCLPAERIGQPLPGNNMDYLMLPVRYTQVLIKDIANKIAVDNRYALQFTRYFNLRDDLNAGVSSLDLKNKHSEWYIFRQEQSDKIPESLWNLAAEAVVGYKLNDLDNGVLTPVPSLERVVYDSSFGETSRFGLGDGQAFMDRSTGLGSIKKLLESVEFDTAPVDKYDFLDSYSFDTPVNIRKAMKYMFVNFSSNAVNTMFFELLQDALADKRDYPGLFKTSWIALHGIKILETVGNVTE